MRADPPATSRGRDCDPTRATLDELLLAGADARIELDDSGLNKYGSAPRHREAVPFGSCTASSPSPLALAAARRAHAELRDAAARGQLDAYVEARFREQRVALARWLHADRVPGAEVVLTPSGTDAELLASTLALADATRPLCNIISGPAEVGSGTTLAAGGHHFSSVTPRGGPVESGSPLSGRLSARVNIELLVLRDETGRMHDPALLDDRAQAMVEAAVARGERVLLHIVAHSKTGAHAPSLARVAALRRRFGEDLSVLVDAAQGRFSRRGLVEILRAGWMVLITGSKFYGGPPFAGALLIPGSMSPAGRGVHGLPAGARDYFTAHELPDAWTELRRDLSSDANIGLLVRWAAALAELEGYYNADGAARYRALRAFEAGVPALLGAAACVELHSVEPPVVRDDVERLLESKTTVFPFCVRHGGRRLGKAALKRVHTLLNQDLSRLTPEDSSALDRRALARSFHLGQPVALGEDGSLAVLRVALGGPLIRRVAVDPELGATLDARITWLEEQLRLLTRKLEWIAARAPQLLHAEAP